MHTEVGLSENSKTSWEERRAVYTAYSRMPDSHWFLSRLPAEPLTCHRIITSTSALSSAVFAGIRLSSESTVTKGIGQRIEPYFVVVLFGGRLTRTKLQLTRLRITLFYWIVYHVNVLYILTIRKCYFVKHFKPCKKSFSCFKWF